MEKVKMPRVRFVFDRKKTANKTNKKGLIEVEVYFNAKRTYFSTGMSVFKDQWKKDAIIGLQTMMEDNKFINSCKTILQDAVNNQFKETQSVNFDELRKIFVKNKQEDKPSAPTFLDFMKERMQARPMAFGTWKQHRSVLNVLTDWGKIRTFADLTPGNIKLWDELSIKNSKTGKSIEVYHKVLRIYVKEAITFADTLNLPKDFRNPYDGFTIKKDRTVKHAFLTIEELDRWRKIKLPTADIDKARDMFVFCAFTGVAFADMKNFNPDNIYINNGGLRYDGERVKTGEKFHITIFKPVQDILRKYNGVPLMDEHVYNRYLKDIACLCNITKTITTHCARVTGACYMLAKGVPLKYIQEFLGHKSIRQTAEYAKAVKTEVDKEFDRVNADL